MPNPDLLSPREQAWVMAAVELVRAGDVRTSRRRFATALEGLQNGELKLRDVFRYDPATGQRKDLRLPAEIAA